MAANDLTIGDALPDNMKSEYPQSVLEVTLTEADQIVNQGMPPTSNLSKADIEDLQEIFNDYQEEGGPNSDSDGSAYWNKTPAENSAYWNKQ
jgi:hypothetical protein